MRHALLWDVGVPLPATSQTLLLGHSIMPTLFRSSRTRIEEVLCDHSRHCQTLGVSPAAPGFTWLHYLHQRRESNHVATHQSTAPKHPTAGKMHATASQTDAIKLLTASTEKGDNCTSKSASQ